MISALKLTEVLFNLIINLSSSLIVSLEAVQVLVMLLQTMKG